MEPGKIPLRRLIRYSLAVLAGIALLAAAIMAWNFYRLSHERVFRSYYRPFQPDPAQPLPLKDTMLAADYRLKDYEGLLKRFGADTTPSPGDIFLAALASLETHDMPRAIVNLEKVIKATAGEAGHYLHDNAQFYQALAFIRNKDYDFALEHLRAIRDSPQHRFHQYITAKLIRRVKLLKWR